MKSAVSIVGGGIVGPYVALRCQQRGERYTLFEPRSLAVSHGFTQSLFPEAMAALASVDLPMETLGFEIRAFQIRGKSDQVIREVPLSHRPELKLKNIYRPHLRAALLKKIPRKKVVSASVQDLQETSSAVQLTTEQSETQPFDQVYLCAGSNSPLRHTVDPHYTVPKARTEFGLVRFPLSAHNWLPERTTIEYWFPGSHVGIYLDEAGGTLAYTRPKKRGKILTAAEFETFVTGLRIPTLTKLLAESDLQSWYSSQTIEQRPHCLETPRITLLGDIAGSLSPRTGKGLVLAFAGVEAKLAEHAAADWTQSVKKRRKTLQRKSQFLEQQMFLAWPLNLCRDLFLRMMPVSIFQVLFRRDGFWS
jgi:2-polyprenyl-6-methoxyphenol hydroxylase-like FAD-dependent oxidoreductase